MRWIGVVLFCAVLTTTWAEPDPKKYKSEVKTKDKPISLTEEERKFLREVEAKFGIKTDMMIEKNSDDAESPVPVKLKAPFPAVIAIEIVNDTDSKSKGKKRTIDANLGYGYRTNNGYTYTYLGKPTQEKGKFMIYPYSQEDIPPPTHNTKLSPNVEITPSQAYELVPTNEEQNSYHYEKPAVEFKSKYEGTQGVETPPPYPASDAHQTPPSTLYTTYNGEKLSGLSAQFPSVMSNYLVDSSQLLQNPQYQSVGLTQDHLRTHGSKLEQRVVPVLVLRIPSSYLRNPTAELYANLPQNYPLSQYLNNVNLQNLVNQYFKKIGYHQAPQIMAYQNNPLESHAETPASVAPAIHYERQQYASPYVQPTYTHADYSGVQYSAVQPVMARYPSSYTRQQYYLTRGQSLYGQPQQQQYVYQYKYVPQSQAQYYVQPQYQYQQGYQVAPQESSQEQGAVEHQLQEAVANSLGTEQASQEEEAHVSAVEYETPQQEHGQGHQQTVTVNYGSGQTATPEYEYPKETVQDYAPTKEALAYSNAHSQTTQTYQYQAPVPKETVAIYHRSQSGHNPHSALSTPTYAYQQQVSDHSGDDGLVLSENYPSKDHTIATVLPISYKTRTHASPVQSVSYVTPVPHKMKYHSQYRVMVPHTVLKHPTNEKVSYVNSHSYSQAVNRDYNPVEEYTASSHYVPQVSKQKTVAYPRNYHSHPKRMTKPEQKTDTSRKIERSEKKKSS